jgi:hypothetical protein
VEPDHRWVQHRVHPGEGLGTCAPAPRTIQGDDALHMLRQGQFKGGIKGDVLAQHRVINQRFGGATSRALAQPLRMVPSVFATLLPVMYASNVFQSIGLAPSTCSAFSWR